MSVARTISSGCWARYDMARQLRWDPCIAHRGGDVDAFIAEYFGSDERPVLFIGGAGFDPTEDVKDSDVGLFNDGFITVVPIEADNTAGKKTGEKVKKLVKEFDI